MAQQERCAVSLCEARHIAGHDGSQRASHRREVAARVLGGGARDRESPSFVVTGCQRQRRGRAHDARVGRDGQARRRAPRLHGEHPEHEQARACGRSSAHASQERAHGWSPLASASAVGSKRHDEAMRLLMPRAGFACARSNCRNVSRSRPGSSVT